MNGRMIREIYFLPPLAIARVGGSDTPQDSFRWGTSTGIHGAHQTVIEPAVSFHIAADGTPFPFLPNAIRFRDGGLLRPVAPFFELWARVESVAGGIVQQADMPLTLALLGSVDADLSAVRYRITVANRKAERRTGLPSCGYLARLDVAGDDHVRRPLLSFSPFSPGEQPLVREDQPIPLGEFQVIRPVLSTGFGEDLSVLRVRFTPAKGAVYGPPIAGSAMAKILPEGQLNSPKTLAGRMHEMVPPENRILNPDTPWFHYTLNVKGQQDPQPADSYDGAAAGADASWGVVDDLCDGVLEAQVVIRGQRFLASARVFSGSPDYSPDRRPYISFADDLADRDLPRTHVDDDTLEESEAEIADLFQRVFEVASQVNLDLERARGVESSDDGNFPGLPKMDSRSMTAQDEPYVDLVPTMLDAQPGGAISRAAAHDPLPYALVAQVAHARLTSIDKILDLLRTRPDHIRRLIRPPFGRVGQFAVDPPAQPDGAFRDPRVVRDTKQDMRMPPYMRDSDENPLSMTWRQYDLLMQFIDYLVAHDQEPPAGAPRPVSNAVRQRVARTVARLRQNTARQ